MLYEQFPRILARMKHIFTFPSKSVCVGLSRPSQCKRNTRKLTCLAGLLLWILLQTDFNTGKRSWGAPSGRSSHLTYRRITSGRSHRSKRNIHCQLPNINRSRTVLWMAIYQRIRHVIQEAILKSFNRCVKRWHTEKKKCEEALVKVQSRI